MIIGPVVVETLLSATRRAEEPASGVVGLPASVPTVPSRYRRPETVDSAPPLAVREGPMMIPEPDPPLRAVPPTPVMDNAPLPVAETVEPSVTLTPDAVAAARFVPPMP